MQATLRTLSLVPRGFVVDGAVCDDKGAVITIRHASNSSTCPSCGTVAARVHSRYRRHLADLPIAGRPMRLEIIARRF
ncbi:transposase family protein, partial [Zavarzinia sp.]|uniref:transposase family protein n=1 Tax=Zavarzinia sp. TaxID=2027920 RepID=UPI003566A8CB